MHRVRLTPSGFYRAHSDKVARARYGGMADTPSALDPSAQNVRRLLAKLRRRWQIHAPAVPMSLCEELEPGIMVGDFCTSLLLAQRKRRSVGAAQQNAKK